LVKPSTQQPEPDDVVSFNAVATEAPAVPGGARVRAIVIPAPGPNGALPSRDGRTHRVPDPARLAGMLNAQEIDVRIDYDHRSEPESPKLHRIDRGQGLALGLPRGGVGRDLRGSRPLA